jgi:type II secretory pathway pseudopilin PulG
VIYTFYSFKGGVGRSMAMASVAWLLARRGLRVLAIDFDLEAPGLERYFFDEEGVLHEVRSRQGLMELLTAYKRALTSESEFERADFKRWQEYVIDAVPRTPEGGSVDLMSSGRRHPQECYAEYALNVRAFDWQDFFQNWRGGGFFDWLRRELTTGDGGYDIVLVDSRTGVTEMGGVCAYQLADVAVLLCAPNYQNLDGTRAVVSDFRSDAVLALRQGRPLELLLLPARVEPSDEPKRRSFFAELHRLFGSEGLPRALADAGLDYERLAVPYEKEWGIIERVVDEGAEGGTTHTAIRASFETLTDALLLLLPPDGRWAKLRSGALARLRGEAAGQGDALLQADVTRRSAGPDVFLIADSGDFARAEAVAAALAQRGLDVWMDRAAMEAGALREDTLQRLKYSRAVLACIGEQPPSRIYWQCYREIQASRQPKPIVGVVVAGAGAPEERASAFGLPPDSALIDCRSDPVQAYAAALQEALIPGSRGASEAPADVAPYPGADPYTEDSAALLFGRDEDSERLYEAIRSNELVVLEGSPGTGKRSLIHAGLLPRMRAREMGAWSVTQTKLSDRDAGAAIEALCRAPDEQPVLHVLYAIDSFPHGGGAAQHRQRVDWIRRVAERVGERSKLLLVGFGSLPQAERDVAMNTWFAAHGGKSTLLRLDPLDPQRLREAIERPAGRVGHLFEPGLVDRLIRDAGNQPGALAQIQLALHDVWTERRRGWLTNKAYDKGGGIAGRHAARLDAFLQEHAARYGSATQTLLKNLVQFDNQLQLFAEPVDWALLGSIPAIAQADGDALRDRLASARLIDLWRAAGPGGEVLWCALAQPAPGPKIEEWARADVEFLLWRQRFSTYVGQPQAGAGALIAGEALAIAERWLGTHREQMFETERALIVRSVAARETESRARVLREKAHTQRRIRAYGGGIALLGTLLAIAIYGFFDAQRELAEAQRQRELVQAERARAEMVAGKLRDVQQSLTSLNEQADDPQQVAAGIRDAREVLQRQSATLAGTVPLPSPSPSPSLGFGIDPGTTAPRIYIQIAEPAQRAPASSLRERIAGIKVGGVTPVVPGIELVKASVPRSVLRCFDSDECRTEGTALTGAINALLASPNLVLEDLSERYGQSKSIRARHYEIWFATGDIALARPSPAQ